MRGSTGSWLGTGALALAGSPYIRQAVTIDTDNELSVYHDGTDGDQ